MRLFGQAIGTYLAQRTGLYSIELPASLFQEMVDLVNTCNELSKSSNHAFLVTNEPPVEVVVANTSWTDLLRWRTDDSRIFAWARGNKEPDSSFRSAVKPFITNRFPASSTSECTVELLARITMEALWNKHKFPTSGLSFDSFCKTANWVIGVLQTSFEDVGSTSSLHWSDLFLEHWATVLDELDNEFASLNTTPLARHAWEIVRVAGLPVPSAIASNRNPFQNPPEEFPEKEWVKYTRTWQDVVETYLRIEGNRAAFLTALDTKSLGASTTPWRGLEWKEADLLPLGVAAPVLGTRVFIATKDSMLSPQPRNFPPRDEERPAWWGVTEKLLEDAKTALLKNIDFRPASDSTTLLSIGRDGKGLYLLNTRTGTVRGEETPRKWTGIVTLENIKFIYKLEWITLTISDDVPDQTREGSAWIRPDTVELKFNNKEIRVEIQDVSADGQWRLAIGCNIEVLYGTSLDTDKQTLTGSWNPNRTLRLQLIVNRYHQGQWLERREDAQLSLLVPSPFNPTIIATSTKSIVIPDKDDDFNISLTNPTRWIPISTPDLLLQEEGAYNLYAYDGRIDPYLNDFVPSAPIFINGVQLTSDTESPNLLHIQNELDNGDAINIVETGGSFEVAVVKVKERSSNVSSGLLAAVQKATVKSGKPAARARDSLLGKYQDNIATALVRQEATSHNSLYQYVVTSTDTLTIWPSHPGTSSPAFLVERAFSLPGIGNGASASLVESQAWKEFMGKISDICKSIGISIGDTNYWLSGFDPSRIPATLIKQYVQAHTSLVKFAKTLSSANAFWASFPFSVVIVDGRAGAPYGQLLAVLLSPLHPVRLAWSFSIAYTARHAKIDPQLLGLAEGWNFPYTGQAVSITGELIQLVAIPTDPGNEQDFVSWSALAVLTHGLVEIPSSAAGLPLPWGGQTGINHKIIQKAITDYLAVHPHLNSLQVDIRSISPTPRSREIDEAVLEYLGTRVLEGVDKLGGGTRVWDSAYREGSKPSRDDLFALRDAKSGTHSFEWRTYAPNETPEEADIAFIENSSVHVAITAGQVNGIVGALPLKRFAPGMLQGNALEQNYSLNPDEDVLGLSGLLAEIEVRQGDSFTALRATPQANALGIGLGAKWEVLGTFNLDPGLLASVVAESNRGSHNRLVWEWRPSWLTSGQNAPADLARRPYYVIARVPSAILRAMQIRHLFTEAQAAEMLNELGHRGIGLASLQATGGTQESAAAGFFYALRLLLPLIEKISSSNDSNDELTVVLPIDPIEPLLGALSTDGIQQRADLLVINIRDFGTHLHFCLFPTEVKHHGTIGTPAPLPPDNDSELGRARKQLNATVKLMKDILESILPASSSSDPIATYARRIGFATILDLAMSLALKPIAAEARAQVINHILNGQISFNMGDPILLWFGPGMIHETGFPCTIDPYNSHVREIFVDPVELSNWWWSPNNLNSIEENAISLIATALEEAISTCNNSNHDTPQADHIYDQISNAIRLTSNAGDMTSSPEQPQTNQGDSVSSIEEQDNVSYKNGVDLTNGLEYLSTDPLYSNEIDYPDQTEASADDTSSEVIITSTPDEFVGWSKVTSRWTHLGWLSNNDHSIGLDFDNPKTIGIFGYMGSGKSYLLGNIVEAAAQQISGINQLNSPLATVVFNYRRNSADRFELSSLALPNEVSQDRQILRERYGALPEGVRDIHILALPGELQESRLQEYMGIPASELLFNPNTLAVEDWELLMGEPGSDAIFARTIRHNLMALRASGAISLEGLEHAVLAKLTKQSRIAAELRFDFVRRYLSQESSIDFAQLIRPGRIVIVDLRQPLFNKDDALRFFLLCANHISRVQGSFNKLVVFDEAHEYLSNVFGEAIETRIRQMRHEGTSYIFATQDVGSIPLGIRRFIATKFVFGLGTRENVDDLIRFAPEFANSQMLKLQPGSCFVSSNESVNNLFDRPRLMTVRPRVTQHGGASRIFSE